MGENFETQEVQELRARIRALEERIRGLRASRRILMNLLASQDREKRARIKQLEVEVQSLRHRSLRYARAVMESQIRYVRLEQRQGQQPGAADIG
jgi:outer membrane murein-binding lipoprotein Lpp